MPKVINFETTPDDCHHWRAEHDGPVAQVIMDVDETKGSFEGYALKSPKMRHFRVC